jgi:hypothetical protein
MAFRYIQPSKRRDSKQDILEEWSDPSDPETEYLTSLFVTTDHLPLVEELKRLKHAPRNRITLMDLQKVKMIFFNKTNISVFCLVF